MSPSRGGVAARASFEDAYDNVAGGGWYIGVNNESASLAWGESYVMMGLASMFRVTQDPSYLDRLARHADSALAQRDDHRGVFDYRSRSGACWRDRHYQAGMEPYCYAVHSGMIASPMVEFALAVTSSGLGAEVAYDGKTFAQKAASYVAAARETVAFHDVEWNAGGWYVFPSDATFISGAGARQPLNQSNAMGRLLLLLHDATQDAAYLDKATKLAAHFKAQISLGSNGEALWNYAGGTYASPGEDISHAAINVDFMQLAAARGVAFTDADMKAACRTFLGNVYVDNATFADHVGGGATNGSSYLAQAGRWAVLTPWHGAVYAPLRDLYESSYAPSGVGSGSLLHAWALLAEHDPVHRVPFFYVADWGTADSGGWREATAYGVNILVTPPALDANTVFRLDVDVPRATRVQQWDGTAYHTVLDWQATGGPASRWVAYSTWYPFLYSTTGGVLFQFADTFVAGTGIRVKVPATPAAPVITSTPPSAAIAAGTPFEYSATGTADGATWWSLVKFPVGARVDGRTGRVTFSTGAPGSYAFTLRFQDDFASVDQSFDVTVR